MYYKKMVRNAIPKISENFDHLNYCWTQIRNLVLLNQIHKILGQKNLKIYH